MAMKELTKSEQRDINGGVLPIAAVVGAAIIVGVGIYNVVEEYFISSDDWLKEY